MTGQDLINFINENHAENMKVMLPDTDSFFGMGRYMADEVKIEHGVDGETLLIR